MSKTAVITTRVDPDLKASAEEVLAKLGMTTAQAITMFLKQVELNQGLPFTPRLPGKPIAGQKKFTIQTFNLGDKETPERDELHERKSIFRYAGAGNRRTYPTAQAADEFISQIRDEWKR
ncbi:MAG: type II toxin-antitoxin system RelB/DinJ family antitoxin [Thiolinea sp.]